MATNEEFKVAKLEDRIAPSSGVVVADNLFNGSANNAGHVSNVGNVSDLANGNSLLHGNTADASGNSIGNAIFGSGSGGSN